MAPTNRKDKKRQPVKPSSNETTLAKPVAKLDKAVVKPNGSDHTGKRKRQDGPTATPKPKKRQTDASGSSAAKGKGKAKKSEKLSSSRLLEEIKALGGNEDDLALVANIDSDAEEEEEELQELGTDAALDDGLKNELAKFASSLGFENVPAEDAETESEEEPLESEDEVDELPPPPKQEPSKGKNSGKLVSKDLSFDCGRSGWMQANHHLGV